LIKMMKTSFVLLAAASTVNAACDNQCSGHGSCMVDDVCSCYDNWGVGLGAALGESGDCSDRVCPFEIAWVDSPDHLGAFHNYAECAGKGICDRGTGLCECFDGYEGKACSRTSCPNDCSGHGTCEYINDLSIGTVYGDRGVSNFESYAYNRIAYEEWDSLKSRQCVCDAQYTDVDCSKRMCPHGDDVLDVRENLLVSEKSQTQYITLIQEEDEFDGDTRQTFALTFKSRLNETFTTYPISTKGTANEAELRDDVHLALLTLPNKVIDKCEVKVYNKLVVGPTMSSFVDNHVADTPYHATMKRQTDIEIVFTGDAVQGPQNLLMVEDLLCDAGCTPKLTGLRLQYKTNFLQSNITETIAADKNSYECGRRGRCDYSTGLCDCFGGYTGENCNTQTTLV
jgi:hypothetical protein